jgi:hypothetical protein
VGDVQHRDLAAGRWWTLTVAEQLGNVGSEISRAAKWQSRDASRARAALYRGLELIDLTLDDPRHRRSRSRLREIARARELVVDFFEGANEYRSSAASLQKYFDEFAVAARRRQPSA